VFRAKVRDVLLAQKERFLEQRASTTQSPNVGEFLRSATDGLISGTSIPFLGPGIYGTGPLSSEALARALLGGTYAPSDLCLATAAEYRERVLNSRPIFLRQLRRVLEAQEVQAQPTEAHKLVTASRGPLLIVDATLDRVLTNRLTEQGEPFAIVTHIVRSAEGKHDGKIVVLRPNAGPESPNAEPEICLADKVNLGEKELVIYKPLGSPFLHDRLDPDLEIDTVVATESDHVIFLSRLENQHTGIPARVQRLLKGRALLFLGYGLDVWQYRLVMCVFRSNEPRGPASATVAVRVADSPLEEVVWRRLGADVIEMDANEFARRLMPESGVLGAG
jgi:hypothetical protein